MPEALNVMPGRVLPTPPEAFTPQLPPGNEQALGLLTDEEKAQKRRKARPDELENLAAHIRRCFQQAEMARNRITGNTPQTSGLSNRLLDCQRRRNGVYDPTRLVQITNHGGTRLYFNVTDTKILAARAWIADVVRHAEGVPCKVQPRPLPDLPDHTQQQIRDQILTWREQAFRTGAVPGPGQPGYGDHVDALHDLFYKLYDRAEADITREATERADRMMAKMESQLDEGGFDDALDDFLDDLVTYPCAILKGPVVRARRVPRWVNGKYTVVTESIPTWSVVNPHDFFPAANARRIRNAWVIERGRIDRTELAAMRGKDGYDEKAIDAVLADEAMPSQSAPMPISEPERATLENRDVTINQGLAETEVACLEFWGPVQGKYLKEWGLTSKKEDDNAMIPIMAILVGEHIIKAIKNPDPLGQNPYFVTSYETLSSDLWGKAIAEKMYDIQDEINSLCRALTNNMDIASFPMAAVDLDSLAEGQDVTKMRAGKIIFYRSSKVAPGLRGRPPITWFQPKDNSEIIRANVEFFSIQADDRTLIPRYSHGNEKMEGAGKTASGMSMLLNAAAKGIQQVLGNLDQDVLRPCIEALYRWNLMYLPDDQYGACKGDYEVVSQGVLGVIVRESQRQRRMDFLAATNNPMDQQIVGVDGRRELLRAIAKDDLGLPVDDIVPTKEQMAATMQERGLAGAVPGAGPMPNAPGAGAAQPAPVNPIGAPAVKQPPIQGPQ